MIIRPLSPDLDWDEYIDLTMRSFGPVDETRVQPNIEPVIAATGNAPLSFSLPAP